MYFGTWKSHIFIKKGLDYLPCYLSAFSNTRTVTLVYLLLELYPLFLREALLSYTFINSHSQVNDPGLEGPLVFFLLACCIPFRSLIMHKTIYGGLGHHFYAAGL